MVPIYVHLLFLSASQFIISPSSAGEATTASTKEVQFSGWRPLGPSESLNTTEFVQKISNRRDGNSTADDIIDASETRKSYLLVYPPRQDQEQQRNSAPLVRASPTQSRYHRVMSFGASEGSNKKVPAVFQRPKFPPVADPPPLPAHASRRNPKQLPNFTPESTSQHQVQIQLLDGYIVPPPGGSGISTIHAKEKGPQISTIPLSLNNVPEIRLLLPGDVHEQLNNLRQPAQQQNLPPRNYPEPHIPNKEGPEHAPREYHNSDVKVPSPVFESQRYADVEGQRNHVRPNNQHNIKFDDGPKNPAENVPQQNNYNQNFNPEHRPRNEFSQPDPIAYPNTVTFPGQANVNHFQENGNNQGQNYPNEGPKNFEAPNGNYQNSNHQQQTVRGHIDHATTQSFSHVQRNRYVQNVEGQQQHHSSGEQVYQKSNQPGIFPEYPGQVQRGFRGEGFKPLSNNNNNNNGNYNNNGHTQGQNQNGHHQTVNYGSQNQNGHQQTANYGIQNQNGHQQTANYGSQNQNGHQQTANNGGQNQNGHQQTANYGNQNQNGHQQTANFGNQNQNGQQQIANYGNQNQNNNNNNQYNNQNQALGQNAWRGQQSNGGSNNYDRGIVTPDQQNFYNINNQNQANNQRGSKTNYNNYGQTGGNQNGGGTNYQGLDQGVLNQKKITDTFSPTESNGIDLNTQQYSTDIDNKTISTNGSPAEEIYFIPQVLTPDDVQTQVPAFDVGTVDGTEVNEIGTSVSRGDNTNAPDTTIIVQEKELESTDASLIAATGGSRQLDVQVDRSGSCDCNRNCAPIQRSPNEDFGTTIREIARSLNAEAFFEFVGLTDNEIETMLSTDGSYTLFIPSNEAVSRLPPNLIEHWRQNNPDFTVALLNHVIMDAISLNQLKQGGRLTSRANDATIFVNNYNNEAVTVNGHRIVHADVRGPRGGLIHVIDGTLCPVADRDIISTLRSCNKYDGFLTLADVTKLLDTMKDDGPYTVFLPSNEALTKIPSEELAVLKENVTLLREFLDYHIVQGAYFSGDLKDGQYLTSLHRGQPIRVGIRVDGCYRRLTEVNNSPLFKADIPTKNGVIHVTDWILSPNDLNWCEGVILP